MATPGQSSLFTNFNELMSTTYRAYSGTNPVDQISNHNALFNRLSQKGNVELYDGGLSIVTKLDYQENTTFTRYSGHDALNISASDVITSAEFPWRQAAIHVVSSGLELRSNNGGRAIINLAKSKAKNAMRTMSNKLSADIYSDGSLANQIGGVQMLIADTPTNTVGGIDASAWPFWRNVVQSAAAPLQGGSAITPSSTTIQSLMLPLYLRLSRGGDHPDVIVFSDDYFTFYEQSLTDLKRYTTDNSAQGGFISLKYKMADVFYDSLTSGIPSSHGFFITTNYMKFVAHSLANMSIMPELRAIGQDSMVTPILFQGNLTCSARFLQGVMKA